MRGYRRVEIVMTILSIFVIVGCVTMNFTTSPSFGVTSDSKVLVTVEDDPFGVASKGQQRILYTWRASYTTGIYTT